MRPSASAEPDLLAATNEIVADVPAGMDLLLPGSVRTLPAVLAAYQPDVLLVFGFNWRLSPEVLALPKLGALNIHPSALPKYRGPSPVLWAIWNGDPCMGLTVHRMTDRIDAGPILSQVDDLPLPERVTSQDVWRLQQMALPDLLEVAFDRLVRDDFGTPQNEEQATYAGFPPPDWYTVTWQGSRQRLHNQVRVLRYLKRGEGPVVAFQGRTVRVDGASLTEDNGVRIECADGPLWVACTPVALAKPCLNCCSQLRSACVRERLKQGERDCELFAAGFYATKGLFAVGEVKVGQGFLPAVADLVVHAGCLAVKIGGVLGIAGCKQHLASTVQSGRFAAVVSNLALQ